MLDRYFVRLTTIDRIRGSWLGESVAQSVTSLAEQAYAARSVFRACRS